MSAFSGLERLVLAVNTVGFAAYLAWLVMGSERIFYTQDGVLFLLPCLPFFFVFVYLFRKHKQPGEPSEEGHG